jgi:hypothetical protein
LEAKNVKIAEFSIENGTTIKPNLFLSAIQMKKRKIFQFLSRKMLL